MGRHGHDRAGAVAHEHEIGDIDGDRRARGRVHAVGPGEHAFFFQIVGRAHDAVEVAHFLHKSIDRRFLGLAGDELGDQRMLGGQAHEGGPEQGVGPGGEDGDAFRLFHGFGQFEGDLRADGLADPVALHGEHAFGPAAELVEVGQQFLGVVGDA